MFQTILDIIYPVRCPICAEIVIPKGDRICPTCKDKLPYISEPKCMKCSKPVEYEEKEYCSDCERKSYHFDRGFGLWIYSKEMKESLSNFKYHSKKEYAKFYIDELTRLYGNQIRKLEPDVIVPVPIHRSKLLDRGYNQADILAKGFGGRLGITVLSDLLIRKKKTVPQKNLSDIERLRNLSEAFQLNDTVMKNYRKQMKRVLLVDDIYTTGSTIEACTNVLKRNDIAEVYFIVLCIGKGY